MEENILLYGISKASSANPPHVEEIRYLEKDKIRIYYQEVKFPQTQAVDIQQAALAYYRILAQLHNHATLIAFRYNTTLQHKKALEEFVDKYAEAMEKALMSVEGHSEFSISFRVKEKRLSEYKAEKPTTGKEYMLSRQREQKEENEQLREVEKLRSAIENEMVDIARHIKIDNNLTANRTFTICSLINDSGFSAYQDKLAILKPQLNSVEYVASGPWPIFSFGNFIEL